MMTRPLGKTGFSIAPLVFGGNVFGWTIDEKTSFALLDAFVDHGFDAIDTADVYSRWAEGNQGGESETIIGAFFILTLSLPTVIVRPFVASRFVTTSITAGICVVNPN